MRRYIQILLVVMFVVLMASSAFGQSLFGAWYVYVNYNGCQYYGGASFSQIGNQLSAVESLILGSGSCPSSLTIYKGCDISGYPNVTCGWHAEPVDMDGETSGIFENENYAKSTDGNGLYWEVWRDCFTVGQLTYCFCEPGICPISHAIVYVPTSGGNPQ
jgi:hypothetical protein